MKIIVIPCFNEGDTLNSNKFESFLGQNPDVSIVFSNDGSTDNTSEVLEAIKSQFSERVYIIQFETNHGKAAAVRAGVLYAHKYIEFDRIAYLDADLSTSLDECLSICNEVKNDIQFAFGSRILKIDNHIERKFHRFIIGRILATIISNQLGLTVYDTQCGCKIFTRELSHIVFQENFISRWLFDVEIFHRIKRHLGMENISRTCREIPLNTWVDSGSSKVKYSYFFRLWFDLIKIGRKYKHDK